MSVKRIRLPKRWMTLCLGISVLFSATAPATVFASTPQPPNFPVITGETSTEVLAIAPGITQQQNNLTTVDGPLQINTVSIDVTNPNVALKALIAKDKVFNYQGETVSEMANRTGAVAGINSDYFDIGSTQAPINIHVADGEMYRSPNNWSTLAIDAQNHPTITKFQWKGNVVVPGSQENLDVWNAAGGTKQKPAGQSAPLAELNWFLENKGLFLYTDKFGYEYPAPSGGVHRAAALLEQISGTELYEVKSITENDKVPLLAANQRMLVGQGTGANWVLSNLVVGMKINTNLTTLPDWHQYKEIVGGGPTLLKDGEIFNDPDVPGAGETNERYPVVGVGIKDDTMSMVVVDGRQPALSIGLTRPQFAEYFKALGYQDAIAFDSGGSAEMVARMPGDFKVSVLNSPSDGFERKVANGLFVYNTAPTGALSQLVVDKAAEKVFVNSHMPLHVKGVDAGLQPVSVDPSTLTYTTTVPGTKVKDGVFTAGAQTGSGEIRVAQGNVSTQVPIEVVDQLSSVQVTPNPAVVMPGASQTFEVKAYDEQDHPVAMDANQGKWTVEGPIGTINEDGVLQTTDQPGEGTVRFEAGGVSQDVKVSVGKKPVMIEDFEGPDVMTNWTATAIRATGKISMASRPNPVRNGTHSLKLDYDFTGQPGTSAAYANIDVPNGGRTIEDRPLSLGVWVYGDGGQHWLRGVLVDGNNTSKPFDFTVDGGLNWTGWKHLTVPIDPNAVLPLKIKQIYVVEPHGDRKNKGAIYLDDLRAEYIESDEDLEGPVFSQMAPVPNSKVYTNKPTISVKLEDAKSGVEHSSIEMHVDGQLVHPDYDEATSMITYTHSEALPDGKHHVTIDASDKAGNPALPRADWQFAVYTGPDQDAPVINVISPMDGITTRTDQPRIAVKVTDEYTGIDYDKTKLIIDGTEVPYKTDAASSVISYTPSNKWAQDSKHQVEIRTSDKSGNPASQLFSFTIGAPLGQPKDKDHFQISLIGDGGYFTAGQIGAPAILLHEQIARMNQEPSELFAYTGDIVENDTPENYVDALKGLGEFTKPYVVTIGNHEVSGTNSRVNYQRTFGEPTYAYQYGNMEIIGLDSASGDVTKSDASQWSWLNETLNQTQVNNIMVMMHIPPDEISADGLDFKTGHGFQNPEEAQKFYDLLGAYKSNHPEKNIVVFSGDLHAYEHKVVQGVDYVITGGGGKYTHVTPEQGGFYHYLNMKVDGDHISWDVIPLLESITFDDAPKNVKKGEPFKLQATGKFMTSTNAPIDMPIADPFKRDWVSSNPDIASVDENGIVTAKAPGEVTITVKSGWQEAQTTIVVSAPPKSTVTADGLTGSGTFNNHDVTLTFSAEDGSAGSGVKQTNYRLDGGNWNTVTGPVTLSDEGVHTIDYFSEDNQRNVEDVQQLIVGIDKTAPTVELTVYGSPLSDGMEFLDSQLIQVSIKASDSLSGVAEQTITLDGQPYTPDSSIDWAGQLGTHTIHIEVKDKAGNVTKSEVSIQVKTSVASMEQLVERYFASGDIIGSFKKQLLDRLANAQEKSEKGKFKSAIDEMEHFLEILDKPSKKDYISDSAKTVLTADANAMIKLWSGNSSSGDRDHEHDQNQNQNQDQDRQNGKDNSQKDE
ncbi:phosphodiester glycosidase family protein [Paenibacillus sp. KQZ6P-2]|uniref:Phosphodiester glycosidase family protein n=1 Tax=Paenibacillus mangrovi TaxID=2931978 RepID=A0A9X2B850_9BACL|nr:phosphodiester glycosidase family protein [Paenibacillus mangrovi]MCJ8014103.1 phosphodiester glycosidase family protein [Paenibacillus mangrovi]